MNSKLSMSEQVVHQYLCGIQDESGMETVVQLPNMTRDLTNDCVITEAQVRTGINGLIGRKLAYLENTEYGVHYGLTSMRDE